MINHIVHKAGRLDITSKEIAALLGISESTWHRRVNNPGQFQLNELQVLSNELGLEFIVANGKISCN